MSSANRLALGDFNGDGVTDVFSATSSANTYQWAYSPGGTGSLQNLAFAATDPALLRFGDFDGDGKTDVFAANQLADGSTQWLFSSGGVASYANLAATTVPYSELKFGDFDGDGKTDVLAALPQADGGLQVVYWPGGLGTGVTLGHIPAPAPALRVGDFNGDGVSDLMALRCGMSGPFGILPAANIGVVRLRHFLYYPERRYQWRWDHRFDLSFNLPESRSIRELHQPSPAGWCRAGNCHPYLHAAAPHQLGADALDFTYYKALQGDFDGDGKTDLALIYPNGTTLTIYIAHSNGDGTFTFGAAQTFTGEAWSTYNPAGGGFLMAMAKLTWL